MNTNISNEFMIERNDMHHDEMNELHREIEYVIEKIQNDK